MKGKFFWVALAMCLSVFFVVCKTPTPTGLTDQDKAAMRKVVDEALKIANASAPDFAAYVKLYYADDATVLPPNQAAVQGQAALISWFMSAPKMEDFKTEIIEIEGRGDLAYIRGSYSMKVMMPGAPAPVQDTGKYIEIWKKQSDGSWKVFRDIFNSDLPASVPSSEAPKK